MIGWVDNDWTPIVAPIFSRLLNIVSMRVRGQVGGQVHNEIEGSTVMHVWTLLDDQMEDGLYE